MRLQPKVHPLNLTTEHIIPRTSRISNQFNREFQDIQIHGIKTQSSPDIFRQLHLQHRSSQLCQICQQKVKSTLFCKVSQSCQHTYCQACVIRYIEFMIDQYRQPKCPSEGCQVLIQCKQELGLVYQKLTRAKRIKLHKILETFQQLKTHHCKGCLVGNLISIVDLNGQKILKCVNCQINTCIKCLNLEHPGQACPKRKSKLPQGFQSCPKCECIIERTKGCVHIKCICGQNFCFQCGKLWTNGHVCEKDYIHRQGLSFVLATALKSILFPFVFLFLFGFLLFFAFGICFVSSLIFGFFIGSNLLIIFKVEKSQNQCLSCLKVFWMLGIFLIFPLIWLIMTIPGFIVPVANIWWDKKITLNPDTLSYLFREFKDYIIAFWYL